MASPTNDKRPIHIGNSSGAINDGMDQLYRLASEGPLDAITADYLAEFNLAWLALEMQENPDGGFERGFLEQLEYKNAAELISQKGIKIVHDGGALNPEGLARETAALFKRKGIDNMVIAWVSGDNIAPEIDFLMESGAANFEHLDIKGSHLAQKLETSEVIAANAYIGMKGIIEALNAGADIVICGRCTDASPVMALAAWWHGWTDDSYDQLAASLMAGHLIECGPYVVGGNFSGFQSIPDLYRVGFPIAEISGDGSVVITQHENTRGAVTVDTVKAQLLYEIQGSAYLNPDVIARIDQAQLRSVGPNRVQLTGITGLPPPPTCKAAISLRGGYQAEICSFAVGVDIAAKVAMQRNQVLRELDPAEYTTISIEPYGTAASNPESQAEATVMIRHFVQSPNVAAIEKFKKALFMSGLQGYPGLFFHQNWSTLTPKPYLRYYPAKVPQDVIRVKAHILGAADPIDVAPPKKFGKFSGQESYDSLGTVDTDSFGPTVRRPIGDICYMRSGDKGGNANVGIWVREESQWPWLQSFLTIERFKSLLAKEYKNYHIERFEAPNLCAVHFVTYGILQDGVSSSSVLDGFAKSHGEFLRARVIDIPIKFFE